MELKTTTLSKAIALVGEKAKCDEACKKVLAEKIILACIMKHTVGEFAEYEVSEIVHRFIDGDPVINKVPILPDETNAPKIPCTGVEDSSMNEGTVKFDIFFHVFLPDIYERVKMIINVEAQDNYYPGYPIVKRGIFYGCRMISSQYGSVFTKSHYEKIQKVYSIWICLTPPQKCQNTISLYSLTEKQLIGDLTLPTEYYDLMTVAMVCLGDTKDKSESELINMLNVMFSSRMETDEKIEILENEFHLPMTEKFKEEVEEVGSFSDYFERHGMERGIEKGIEHNQISLITSKLKKNKTIEQIADEVELSIEKVEEYIQMINASTSAKI